MEACVVKGLHPQLSVTEKTLATEPQGNDLAANATNKITRCVCEMCVWVSVREFKGKENLMGGKVE